MPRAVHDIENFEPRLAFTMSDAPHAAQGTDFWEQCLHIPAPEPRVSDERNKRARMIKKGRSAVPVILDATVRPWDDFTKMVTNKLSLFRARNVDVPTNQQPTLAEVFKDCTIGW